MGFFGGVGSLGALLIAAISEFNTPLASLFIQLARDLKPVGKLGTVECGFYSGILLSHDAAS
jgi:hypothetical protein